MYCAVIERHKILSVVRGSTNYVGVQRLALANARMPYIGCRDLNLNLEITEER